MAVWNKSGANSFFKILVGMVNYAVRYICWRLIQKSLTKSVTNRIIYELSLKKSSIILWKLFLPVTWSKGKLIDEDDDDRPFDWKGQLIVGFEPLEPRCVHDRSLKNMDTTLFNRSRLRTRKKEAASRISPKVSRLDFPPAPPIILSIYERR